MAVGYVLWAIALLSTIAVSLQSEGITAFHLSRNARAAVQNEAMVEWAIHATIVDLLDTRPERRPDVTGKPSTRTIEHVQVRVHVRDELGKVDLNQTDRGALSALLRAQGLARDKIDALVDKIEDWREPGPLRRLNGAKADDYRRAGFSYAPRGGPFQTVDELKLVIDMTAELFRRLEPAITVYSGKAFVDPRVAPREVLLALPGATSDSVAVLLRERERSGASPLLGMSLAGRAYSIRAEIVDRTSARFAREAVVRFTDDPQQPFWILSWRRIALMEAS